MTYTPVRACRSCGGTDLPTVLDLGEQPLANGYRRPDALDPEDRWPLAVVLCTACSLVQLAGTVPPRSMFDDYPYFSSYATTMVDAMRSLAHRVTDELRLGVDDLVVEVASNDGYLLRHYLDRGVGVLGVEPARNVAEVAARAGVPTVVAYFGVESATAIRAEHGPARVLHANNVMAHVPDINDFVAGFEVLLADEGRAYVESPYLGRFVEDCEFDTVYHEHVFYYSLTAIERLVTRHGLAVVDVEHLSIHGGTLRCTLARTGTPRTPAVGELLAEEERLGVADPSYYARLQERVADLRVRTRSLLLDLKGRGARIACYGAAAKGTVLLNHFGIGTDLVDVVVDRNPHKQGLLMPGVGIPIASPDALADDPPTHLFVLVWNLLAEVAAQQRPFLDAGGELVVAIPEPTVIGAGA